ncbi:MAG: cytochrome c oxidase subunit II [Leptolyngbyaceae cyanobacterium RU_5_1]|nr:cytochrome c oxidase subunit II [Leptolyngbyaceae cyanobacterium RU_5_1]
MKIPSNILTLLVGITLTLISLWFGYNHSLLPIAASREAELVDGLFNAMMAVSIGLFLVVQGALVVALFKFRRRPGDLTDGPHIHGNIPLEILWTVIPTVIVFIISVYSFDVYGQLGGFDPNATGDSSQVQVAMLPGEDASAPLMDSSRAKPSHHHEALGIGASPEDEGKPADLTVDVMGMQYAWLFNYPNAGVTSAELHVPVNQEVQLNIKAQDVIHAFWLPEFRLKQDAIPGQPSELRIKPRRVGEYPVICAELCGPYHGGMVTKLFVDNQQDYDNWLQSQIASQDSNQTTALVLDQQTDGDFLAPFVSDLGVTPDIVQQVLPRDRA